MTLPPIPPLFAARTLLREVTAADLSDLFEVNADPQVTRFLPYATWQSAADAESWLARMLALAVAGSARQLVIGRRDDGRIIGTALLFRHDEGSGRLELGYVLGRAHWRRGYATDALRRLLAHVFGPLGMRRVEAEVDPANAASNALLRRLGFTHEGLLRDRWVAKGRTYGVNVYGLLADEWPPGRGESSPPWQLRIDDLSGADVQALVAEHLAGMHGNSPPGAVNALALDSLRAPEVTFWTAWRDGQLCGCGALKALSDEAGEVKSMRTRTACLGQGVGQAVLDQILAEARRRGYRQVLLETGTGDAFAPAHALYRKNGFVDCAAFGDYQATEFNVFMVRPLSP